MPVAAVDAQVPPPPAATDTQTIAPGVRHRDRAGEDVTTERPVIGDLLEVDLRNPRVSLDLLHPGAVADRPTRPSGRRSPAAGP